MWLHDFSLSDDAMLGSREPNKYLLKSSDRPSLSPIWMENLSISLVDFNKYTNYGYKMSRHIND